MYLSRKLLFFGVLAIAVLSGCSKSDLGNARALKPNGISQTLTKQPGGPSWNLEVVGGNNKAWESKLFELPAHQEQVISGWAVDQQSKQAAGGVEMVIDGALYAAQYGGSRPDVVNVFGTPAYANSGYVLKLPGGQFAAGAHTMFVRVISSDRQGYWEVGPYSLIVN